MLAALLGVAGVTLVAPAGAANWLPDCSDCALHIGIGGTYHFWAPTAGVVVPITVDWDQGRWEAGVFRMATSQRLYHGGAYTGQTSAEPYWGVSASRRWTMIHGRTWRSYFGFGASYKTDQGELSVTHWNFASQVGVQFAAPWSRSRVEVAVRHWSNGGLRLPNRGQDFLTLSVTWSPTPVRWFFSAGRPSPDDGRRTAAAGGATAPP